ncbi:TPA: NAD(P)-dependent oxidoreductase [Candidatus Gracilibacteria bacterium]|nr:NAD(P)-dependent oxidoreductase [Candidatus Gracilibacteria bacterium]
MKKILLLGAQGMLGSEIFNMSLEMDTIEIVPFSRFNLDLTKEEEIVEKIQTVLVNQNIDLVINASAYTIVDKCEEGRGEELSLAINAVAPKYIVEACSSKKIPLFHFSTDYVFSGDTNQSFDENDDTEKFSPVNKYGMHKLFGEKEVLQYEKGFVLRTSWLAGQYGQNFVNKIVHLMKNVPDIKIIKNEWGNPSFTPDVAESVLKLAIEKELPKNKILHIVNERGEDHKGGVSRLEFVEEIKNYLGFETTITPVKRFETLAERPLSTALNNNLIEKLPHWKIGLHNFLEKEKEKIEKNRKVTLKKEKAAEKYRAQQKQQKEEREAEIKKLEAELTNDKK